MRGTHACVLCKVVDPVQFSRPYRYVIPVRQEPTVVYPVRFPNSTLMCKKMQSAVQYFSSFPTRLPTLSSDLSSSITLSRTIHSIILFFLLWHSWDISVTLYSILLLIPQFCCKQKKHFMSRYFHFKYHFMIKNYKYLFSNYPNCAFSACLVNHAVQSSLIPLMVSTEAVSATHRPHDLPGFLLVDEFYMKWSVNVWFLILFKSFYSDKCRYLYTWTTSPCNWCENPFRHGIRAQGEFRANSRLLQ